MKGKIIIKLDEYLKKQNISKTKLTQGAAIQMTQLLKYCRNQVSRVDLDVLARMCNFLECDLNDIMVYEIEK
ncbi:MAG: helix-turn-helix transcriptional regulator [Oscillospiraceae bacterium]|nr:helix-turn-helix transcriptional regulator [Oscillospiraceae bacterium]